MEAVTYPLPVPQTPEELEQNLAIIGRDLSLTREQIVADAQRFAKGEPLPDGYSAGDRGYLSTLLAVNLGFRSEAELWGEKCQVVADNLTHFIEAGQLTPKKLTTYVQAVSRSWVQKQNFKDPYAETELGPTMSFLKGALWTAFEVGEDTGILATIPMVCLLVDAGQATPLDLVQLVYDTIVAGIDEDEAAEA